MGNYLSFHYANVNENVIELSACHSHNTDTTICLRVRSLTRSCPKRVDLIYYVSRKKCPCFNTFCYLITHCSFSESVIQLVVFCTDLSSSRLCALKLKFLCIQAFRLTCNSLNKI